MVMSLEFVFLETIIILMLVTMALTTMLTTYTVVVSKSKEREYYDRVSDKYLLYSLSNLGTTESADYIKLANNLETSVDHDCNTFKSSDYSKYLDCLSQKIGVLKFDVSARDCATICEQIGSAKYQVNSKKVFCDIFGKDHVDSQDITFSTSTFKDTINGEKCTTVFEELQLYRLYFVKDIAHTLSQPETTLFFNGDNGVIEYMKSLKKCYNENVYVEYQNKETGESCTPGSSNCIRVVLNELVTDSTVCSSPVRYLIGVFMRNHDYYYASIEI